MDSARKFIICNADEGDPGAFSDRYLLEEKPWEVLLGMVIAGYVTGATWGIVYIRGEYPESVEIIQHCIEQLRANELIGEKILGTLFDFDFKDEPLCNHMTGKGHFCSSTKAQPINGSNYGFSHVFKKIEYTLCLPGQ